MDPVRLYAQCHCKKQTFHVDVPKSSLPLFNETCHCDDDRHITGLLAGDFAILPPETQVFDEDRTSTGLSRYIKPGGRVRWYFCQTCGAHIVQSAPKEDGGTKWLMSLGTLYPLELADGTKTTRLQRHSFVKYGRDLGGLARFLPDGVPRYADGTSTEAITDQRVGTEEEEEEAIRQAAEAPKLPLRCHCGHVQLHVHRPSSSPVPEAFKGAVVGDSWLWTFCLCHSCRTTSGFDTSCYFFAPYTHITGSSSSSHPTDGLSTYSSYPGHRRHFCPTCGACVFFDRADRGDLCDVFLGLVDVPLAALFSSWIRPAKKISFWAYAKNKELAQTLAKGFCPDEDLSLTQATANASAEYDGALVI